MEETGTLIPLKHDFEVVKKSSEFTVALLLFGTFFFGTIIGSSLGLFGVQSIFDVDLPAFLSQTHITILFTSLIFPGMFVLMLKMLTGRSPYAMRIGSDGITMLYLQGEFTFPFANLSAVHIMSVGRRSAYPFLRLYIHTPIFQNGRVRKGLVTFISQWQLEGSGYTVEQIAAQIQENSKGVVSIKK